MAWQSFFKRIQVPEPPSTVSRDPAALVEAARTRARRRLIGAVVLVVTGIVGFPLVFETKPRPIPVDIAIELARNDVAPPLMTASRPSVDTASAGSIGRLPTDISIITETRGEAGREVVLPSPEMSNTAPPAAPEVSSAGGAGNAAVASRSSAVPADHAASAPAARPAPSAKSASAADAARALALLEGVPASKPAAGRFVVQVGAFAESAAANETRQRIEKLGLKTYTQVALTPAGSRIRVRVGPFATRDEADRAQARAKAAGLAAVVLTL